MKSNKTNPQSDLHINENLSLEEQIEQQAHELWHARGRHHGGDLGDWLQAEREINEWHRKRVTGNH